MHVSHTRPEQAAATSTPSDTSPTPAPPPADSAPTYTVSLENMDRPEGLRSVTELLKRSALTYDHEILPVGDIDFGNYIAPSIESLPIVLVYERFDGKHGLDEWWNLEATEESRRVGLRIAQFIARRPPELTSDEDINRAVTAGSRRFLVVTLRQGKATQTHDFLFDLDDEDDIAGLERAVAAKRLTFCRAWEQTCVVRDLLSVELTGKMLTSLADIVRSNAQRRALEKDSPSGPVFFAAASPPETVEQAARKLAEQAGIGYLPRPSASTEPLYSSLGDMIAKTILESILHDPLALAQRYNASRGAYPGRASRNHQSPDSPSAPDSHT